MLDREAEREWSGQDQIALAGDVEAQRARSSAHAELGAGCEQQRAVYEHVELAVGAEVGGEAAGDGEHVERTFADVI